MIAAVNVTKTYPAPSGALHAVKSASMTIADGDFAAILGRSGAGKSTLLAIIGGMLRPTSGSVWLDGVSLWEADDRTRAAIRSRGIGFVFQNSAVIRSLSVLENAMLADILAPAASSSEERALELLDCVGLGGKARAFPHQLSGGECRRLAIASALFPEPRVLLADEPTGDLDAEMETRIMRLFSRLSGRRTTVVIVTHNRDLTRYANRVFEMDAGCLSELPNVEELVQ